MGLNEPKAILILEASAERSRLSWLAMVLWLDMTLVGVSIIL